MFYQLTYETIIVKFLFSGLRFWYKLILFLIGFTFIKEKFLSTKSLTLFLVTQLSNYLNAIVACKETIHTGDITVHAFANLSLKSSGIFLP